MQTAILMFGRQQWRRHRKTSRGSNSRAILIAMAMVPTHANWKPFCATASAAGSSHGGSKGSQTEHDSGDDAERLSQGPLDEEEQPQLHGRAGGAAENATAGKISYPVAGPATVNPLPTRPMHHGGLKEGVKDSKRKLGKDVLEVGFAQGKGMNIAENLPENSELAGKQSTPLHGPGTVISDNSHTMQHHGGVGGKKGYPRMAGIGREEAGLPPLNQGKDGQNLAESARRRFTHPLRHPSPLQPSFKFRRPS